MDSITQITLGAAVGEVVLGKKAGNRAMVWGAIAGTIPDLDVFANAVTDEMSAMAYHRAFTHSLAFAVVTPVVLGALVHRLYGGREGPLPNSFWQALLVVWLAMVGIILLGSSLMPVAVYNVPKIALCISTIIILFPALARLRENWRRQPSGNENPGMWAWAHLFFWATITHPLLDACTTYGTQLLSPFSDLRVAWNAISVADPLYTAPFLLCLIIASFINRKRPARRWFNWAGIIISSAYLLFSFYNHHRATQIFENSLAKEQVISEHYLVTPTILNNILWSGTAEIDSTFMVGQYSFFDQTPYFQLRELPKNHQLIAKHWNDRDIQTLRWFSDGYFNIVPRVDSTLQYNDLRFGGIIDATGKQQDYVFYFILREENGVLKARSSEEFPEGSMRDLFRLLWERIMGI